MVTPKTMKKNECGQMVHGGPGEYSNGEMD